MPVSSKRVKAIRNWNSNNYKTIEVNLSINDHATIKHFCKQNELAMSGFIYDIIIKAMAERGIRLEGTATRNIDDILNRN